jgi:hydroxyacylglutathione hydrolase
MLEIQTITVPFMLHITVNCYLIRAEGGFLLIDTGKTGKAHPIEAALEHAGCQPGDLKLIILTHGDFDHCGSAAYLRKQYGGKIAMHDADRGMGERGDMYWNRQPPNALVRALTPLLARLPEANRFSPDITLKEGDSLSAYGLDARVIELPGHSKGSIGILTAEGDLFCGDLLANRGKPAVWSIIDNPEEMTASVEKLKEYAIRNVYPGHGNPFPMTAFHA